jgi:CRP/FNR family transcriptional regulator
MKLHGQTLTGPDDPTSAFPSNLSLFTAQLRGSRKQLTYPRGALVYAEGDVASGCFILTEGRVKLTVSSRGGIRLILNVVGAGGVLGLYAAISGAPHQVSAETLEPSKASFVKREDLLSLMREDTDFRMRVLENLCNQYRNACAEVGFLGGNSAARLAKFLLDSLPEGAKSERQWRLQLGMTHDEIAEKIGVARETVTRLMAELQKRHILLNVKRSHLVIRDIQALSEIASGSLIVRRDRT